MRKATCGNGYRLCLACNRYAVATLAPRVLVLTWVWKRKVSPFENTRLSILISKSMKINYTPFSERSENEEDTLVANLVDSDGSYNFRDIGHGIAVYQDGQFKAMVAHYETGGLEDTEGHRIEFPYDIDLPTETQVEIAKYYEDKHNFKLSNLNAR